MNLEASFKIFSKFYKLKAFVFLITLTSIGDNCYLCSSFQPENDSAGSSDTSMPICCNQ